MHDVTVIGPALIDILAAPFELEALQRDSRYLDQIRMSFGGDALNESAVLARLGKKVQLISKVGHDEAGAEVLSYLKKNGISTEDVLIGEGVDTAVNIALISPDGSRKFLMNPHSSLRKLRPEEVLGKVDSMAAIVSFASMFISPLFSIEQMKTLFARIKSSGRTLFVDMTRPKNRETIEDVLPLLPYMDVFAPNHEEIASLTGESDPARNVKILIEGGVGCAAVKIGKDGCLMGIKDVETGGGSGEESARIVHIPAVPGVQCVDTTGAGDSFAAGFILGMSNGWNMKDCARLGCAAASCSVEQIGATDGVCSAEQVLERLRLIP